MNSKIKRYFFQKALRNSKNALIKHVERFEDNHWKTSGKITFGKKVWYGVLGVVFVYSFLRNIPRCYTKYQLKKMKLQLKIHDIELAQSNLKLEKANHS
jgi:hypothetical protein